MACNIGRVVDRIEIRVPCKAEYVRTVRRTLADFAESVNMPRASAEEVELATSEAVSNVIRHAYVGLDRIPSVRVKCSQRRGGLTVEIADSGCGFSVPQEMLVPGVDKAIEREGGLGIVLIRCLMDRVVYVSCPEKGTKIRMTKFAAGDERRKAVRTPRCSDRENRHAPCEQGLAEQTNMP